MFLRPYARFLTLLCLTCYVLVYFFPQFWWIELTSHFLPQQILLFVISLAVWLCPSRRGASVALAFLSVLLVGVAFSLPNLFEAESRPVGAGREQDASEIQLITFNVLSSNLQRDQVTQWLLSNLSKDRVNVVVLLEVNSFWADSLRPLEKALPYNYLRPRGDNFGIAIYSSQPIEEPGFDSLESFCEVPQFSGLLRLGSQSVQIFGIHTIPPGPLTFDLRNNCLTEIEKRALASEVPAVVTGDLNCSPWSPWFPDQLKDSFPYLARPHTWSDLGGLVSTALDHTLVTPGLKVRRAEVGPDLGSDHLPVIVHLSVSR